MTQGTGVDLAKRVGVALVGIPVAIGLGYLGGYWLAAFLALLAALAAWELFSMNAGCGLHCFPRTGSTLALVFVLLAAAGADRFALRATLVTLVLATPVMLRASADSKPGLAAALTVFGAIYTGGLIAFALWLRDLGGAGHDWRGAGVLFLPIAVTWIGDTAAYAVGKTVGRRPFAPTISPRKTWEGAIAGLLAGALVAPLYVEVTRPLVDWTLTAGGAVGLGVLASIAGQAGDLVESRFKRDCGVKDSSDLLPGHGGMLDRLDSLLFVLPVSYAYLRALGV